MTDAISLGERFAADGFVAGVPVLTEAEADAHRAALDAIEAQEIARRGGSWPDRDHHPLHEADHPLAAWALALATTPTLIDAVGAILGPHLLIRNADVFVKAPRSDVDIAWHLDTRRTTPDVDGMLTAWIPLTPASAASGALEYARGTHRLDLSHGADTRHQLTLDRRAIAHLDPASIARPRGPAGHASFHHFRTAHRSGPNRTAARRVAFVVRFMTPAVSCDTAECLTAVPVGGADPGPFQPVPTPPISWTGPT